MNDRDPNLSFERMGNLMTVRSVHTFQWFGVLFGGFALFWLRGWVDQESAKQGGEFWFGVMMGSTFALLGLFLLIPRELHTVFDLKARRVSQHLRFAKGLYESKRSYAFDDVEALGVREYRGDDITYKPYLKARDGKTLSLATNHADLKRSQEMIADICSRTGLTRRDI
jgi:hypothetical protein